jgi:hypothetical protein
MIPEFKCDDIVCQKCPPNLKTKKKSHFWTWSGLSAEKSSSVLVVVPPEKCVYQEEDEEEKTKGEKKKKKSVCRLKSFVRLLISNCHPSLAPPLVSQTLFFFFSFLSIYFY